MCPQTFCNILKHAKPRAFVLVYVTSNRFLYHHLKEEFKKLLQEFETLERFKELEGLRGEHSKNGPAWYGNTTIITKDANYRKYSGIPSEDYSTFSNITAQTFLPQYEALYSEVRQSP